MAWRRGVAWWSVACHRVEWRGGWYSCSAAWHGVDFCPSTKIDDVEWWSLVRSACCGRGIEKTEMREKTGMRRRRERYVLGGERKSK